ncbi:MAG: L-serine dehydratase [Tepidanaerobacteraceae bacterium]|nr:L-serine dehydratase [Tepidanaerobacteraceae bacterium]
MRINTLSELINLAEKRNQKISSIIKEQNAKEQGLSERQLFDKMEKIYQVMKQSAERGVFEQVHSMSGITGGEGYRLWLWQATKKGLSGSNVLKASARAMAVSNINASMGKIVAAPTAGSSGIIPGVIITVAEELKKRDEEAVDALFTAAAVGQIIAKNATLAGAEGGCQAECGSASAMAAAAAVELAGGSPRQVGHAVAFALKAVMGMVCDPVAGLVEVPCVKRNAMGAVQAMLAADMALAGIKSVIPPDEVIQAMGEVGRMIPEQLRETALGGLANTPTGKDIKKRCLNNL